MLYGIVFALSFHSPISDFEVKRLYPKKGKEVMGSRKRDMPLQAVKTTFIPHKMEASQ